MKLSLSLFCATIVLILAYLFLRGAKVVPVPSFFAIPVQEMSVTFISNPSKTIDQETSGAFPIVINGAYF